MPNPFSFAAVLFDLDGVVIDTTELHYRVWEDFGRAHGHVPTRDELLATNGRRSAETIRGWLGAHLDDVAVAKLSAACDEMVTRRLRTDPLSAVPGVQEYVAALAAAGVPRAVATSATPINTQVALERVGLAGRFDAIVTAGDVRLGKPNPEAYLKAAAALGVPPERCVVFEDSLAGLQAAQAAGAKCAAVATTFPVERLEAERPDWIIPDFREMPAELRPWSR